MTNPLVRPEHLCKGSKHDGSPCSSPRRRGQPFCISHSPGRAKPVMPPPAAVPSDALDVLAALDFSDPANVSRFRRGMLTHVLAGSLPQSDATAAMRFAEAEAAAASRAPKQDALAATIAHVIATPPPRLDD